MSIKAVEVVGQIVVPTIVMKHRFVSEVLGNLAILRDKDDTNRTVVGTANTQECELYGWERNVDPHVDNTGIVYLVCLNEGASWLHAWTLPDAEDLCSVELRRGSVVRLNDFREHWTEDRKGRVAAFIGSFDAPCDAHAVEALSRGVQALAEGAYYGAPRVREGFRAMLPDECYAATAGMETLEPMLLADAEAQGRFIERCAMCELPAVRPDMSWPYFMDKSRCREHIGK